MNQPQQIQINLDDKEAEGIYSNLAFCHLSPSEFILDFAHDVDHLGHVGHVGHVQGKRSALAPFGSDLLCKLLEALGAPAAARTLAKRLPSPDVVPVTKTTWPSSLQALLGIWNSCSDTRSPGSPSLTARNGSESNAERHAPRL
jgi:hypothetical protein